MVSWAPSGYLRGWCIVQSSDCAWVINGEPFANCYGIFPAGNIDLQHALLPHGGGAEAELTVAAEIFQQIFLLRDLRIGCSIL